MTSRYCWICMEPGTTHVTGQSWLCNDHAEGTSTPYLEEGHID